MLSRLITLGSCWFLVGGTQAATFPQTAVTNLDKFLAKYDSKATPGIEVLVVQDGKELYRRCVGMANLEYGTPISSASVFHIASVSKQFTAFAACLLEQQGKLNLDDDVRKYLPELPYYGSKMTLRHLATHTSGLRDFYDLNALVGFTETDVSFNGQVLRLLFQQKHLNFNPGTKFEYGNSSYTLLGEVVSRVAKQPLAEFLSKQVFKPLGMNHTLVVDDPEMIVPKRVNSYHVFGGVLYKRLLGPVNVGSTGINSTADDLIRWSQNFENPKVGNQNLLRRMSQRAKLSDGTVMGYALGQEFRNYRGLNIAFHGGGDAGYRSYLIRIPEKKFTVVVLSNSREFFPHDVAYGAVDEFLLGGPAVAKPQIKFDPGLLQRFVGYYEIYPGYMVQLTTEKGKLFLQTYGDSQKMELPRVGNYEFKFPILGYSTFVFDHSKNFKWRLFDMTYPVTRVNLKPFNPATVRLKELEGTYYSSELRDEYILQVKNKELVATHRRNDDITLTPIQKDWFHGSSGFFGKVVPVRNQAGHITGIKVSAQRAPNILFRRVGIRQS